MTSELREYVRVQRDAFTRALLQECHVLFCERCFEPFDYEPRPRGKKKHCPECKRELKSIENANYRHRQVVLGT